MQNDITDRTEQDDPELRALLKDYPMPEATAGYFDQALVRATRQGAKRQRNRWLATGFGGAIAAGLVLWMVGGFFLTAPDLPTEAPTIPGITMTLETPRTINLVFASTERLDSATLTVLLPDGIEMSGFPGQREITWQTSLDAGKNLLPLKLIATSSSGGEVFATLTHDDRGRTFRLRIDIA